MLQNYLRQKLVVEHFVDSNEYDEYTYSEPVEYRARIQQKVKMVRNTQGQEVVSNAQIYLEGKVPITVKDRITLPDGMQPLIQSISNTPDKYGRDMLKVVYV